MFLYPRTITTLHHHWEHPAIPNVEQFAVEAEQQKSVASAIAELQHYCREGGWDAPSYNTLLVSARHSARFGSEDYLTINGEDASGTIPPEVIENLKIVLENEGMDCSRWNPTYYSCAC
jgi:hypothetical protein